MAKKSSASLAHGGRTPKKGRSTWVTYDSGSLLKYFLREQPEVYGVKDPDAKIDYSEIPELTSEQMKKAKHPRVGRPPMGVAAKTMISIKIDPVLLAQLKAQALKERKGYQTLIHEVLAKYVRN